MKELETPVRTSDASSAPAPANAVAPSFAPLDTTTEDRAWMSSLTTLSRKKHSPLPWIAAVAALALASAFGAWWVFSRAPAPVATIPEAPVAAPADAVAPTLEGSDPQVRDWAGRISSSQEWLSWMSGADLVRRFVGALFSVADGASPRAFVTFLTPRETFEAAWRSGRLYASPASFARYDGIARVVGGLDVQQATSAWRALEPLFARAHQEIAPPGRTLSQTLDEATAHLIAVPLPEKPLRLVERGALYAYADPDFERLTAAQKHLLRMGPDNARVVQSKLRELRAALGMPEVPQPTVSNGVTAGPR
ncbi:MAG TPA: DUF3014 domain-containing protein [Myxococcaceae bacterium]|nr:DUF3014 domain-containing protein [Myxococcaceae bacterium]